ncbi:MULTISPECIES: hypothetical protein [Pseudoalteromonas]|uniref:Uncharacterized protein n=1 Tax=Pseudoalteromonas galatheae TaxID=579562 RepID=A0A8T6YLD8_9GAMM|nr:MULTISPECIES: hypothetical protein [Pseudoalteromonas]MCG9760376.1 hypothetical protein [Pseudoalteromonas sp. Isolate6]NKC18293.1 hypothetical protein [Pseudoalteromonas galatheae]
MTSYVGIVTLLMLSRINTPIRDALYGDGTRCTGVEQRKDGVVISRSS